MIAVAGLESALGLITLVAYSEAFYKAGFAYGFWGSITFPLALIISLTGFFTYRFRETRAMSLGEYLERRYSRSFRIFASFLRTFSEMLANTIMPAIAARFFIYLFGWPSTIELFGWKVPTFSLVIVLTLFFALIVIWAGGMISLVVTDALQAIMSYPIFLILTLFILIHFSWFGQVVPVLSNQVPGESFLNPYDVKELRDFNLFTVFMGVLVMIMNIGAWCGGGTDTAAKTAHEGKMAGVLGRWRNGFSRTMMFRMRPASPMVRRKVPAQLMAAVSANKPMIFLPGGPMLPGNYKGESLACGTDSFKLWTKHLAGEISAEELKGVEGCLYGSIGACPIMGTANSMQCATESLGLSLPGSASALAVSAEKMRYAEETGRQIMTLIERDIKPKDIVSEAALRNCITVLMASGGSTNLIIHLTAIARRAGITLPLSLFQEISDRTKLLVDVKPSGKGTVGIEFHQAGGVPALMKELESLLDGDVMTVTGKTLKENLKNVQKPWRPDVIASLEKPLAPNGGIAVLHGNLAPRGAVIKRSAASILKFRGEARVFDTLAEAEKYLLDPESDMDENKAIILRGYGPKGAPGMPEFGNYMPIPPKLYKRGIRDYVRITDSRMSGGAFGTVVLHVCPEACDGGPLGAVRNGDIVEMDVEKGILNVELSPEEIAERLRTAKCEPREQFERGFVRHYMDNVLQADEGCDFAYLR